MSKEISRLERKIETHFPKFARVNQCLRVYLGKVKEHLTHVNEVAPFNNLFKSII